MPETRQRKILRMLGQLEADHGSTITNALMSVLDDDEW